jgi:hypothetical protein
MKSTTKVSIWMCLIVALMVLVGQTTAIGAETWPQRVSVALDGNQNDLSSYHPVTNADGRHVAFTSSQWSELSFGNYITQSEVFLRDRLTNETTCITVAYDGARSNGNSSALAMSSDGRFVVFTSVASNIVPEDTNGMPDVFVYDRDLHTNSKISSAAGGGYAIGHSISDSGRYIVYTSHESYPYPVNLLDRTSGSTEQIATVLSVANAFISGDGHYVFLYVIPENWTSDNYDLYMYDRVTGKTTFICNDVGEVSLNSSGEIISFTSKRKDLVPQFTPAVWNVFVRDLKNNQTELVSIDQYGSPMNISSGVSSISADGRYVVFSSPDTSFVPPHLCPFNNTPIEIFIRDRLTKETTSVIGPMNSESYCHYWDDLTMSNDGLYIIFTTSSPDLIMDDTNGSEDVLITLNPIYTATVDDNHPPKADAGPNQTVHVSTSDVTVTLDGSKSSDIDKDYPLAYSWSFVSVPDGATPPIINDATTVSPTFSIDHAAPLGDYTISLVVTDNKGLASAPATVTISTYDSLPVADAGKDQKIRQVGTIVTLDGGKSHDPDGDTVCYTWSFDSIPEGSVATFSDLLAESPTFVADIDGDYVVRLNVHNVDASGICVNYWGYIDPNSPQTDTITISFTHLKAKAKTTGNQATTVGSQVTLSGTGEGDPDGSPLTYSWSMVSKPDNSTATLLATDAQDTGFTADQPGQYVASLVVSDGITQSDPSNVTVTVVSYQDAATDAITAAINAINATSDDLFNNPNNKNVLTNKLGAVLASINADKYSVALNQMTNDVLTKTDGCATTGTVDQTDWIKAPGNNPLAADIQAACTAQGQVYPLVMEAIGYLQNLQ